VNLGARNIELGNQQFTKVGLHRIVFAGFAGEMVKDPQ